MPLLFRSLPLLHQHLQNRIVVAPMCQYSAENGYANNWHLVHLGQYALGGAGAIIQEGTAISPEGRITYADLGIWEEGHIDKLREITTFIKERGSVAGIQLAHAGRKASTEKPWIGRHQIAPDKENGWQTFGPSANAFHPKDHPAVELSEEGIQEIITQFVTAAQRAIQAGYEIIEIHAAHGYLLHQFLSPLVNERKDKYGGSFENRIRLTLEVIQAVKETLDTQSLWVRISATDWADGGWDLEQSVALAKRLKEIGVEVIDVSSGGAVRHQQIITGPNYQVAFAEKIKKETNLITGTVGMITEAKQAEKLLKENKADLVFFARKMLREPYFPIHAAKELKATIRWQEQYLRGKETY